MAQGISNTSTYPHHHRRLRRRLGNPAVPLMPSLRAMREQSRRVGKTRFRPREPARDSQTHSWVRSWRSVPELQLLELLLLSRLLQSIGLVVNLPARGVDSYYMTSPLIGRGPRAWPGRRGAPFPPPFSCRFCRISCRFCRISYRFCRISCRFSPQPPPAAFRRIRIVHLSK